MANGPVITVRGRRTILTVYARGRAVLRYRYSTIDARFSSPLVNPWNLAFVAQGLYYDESVKDEILIQRVIDGRKPAAFTAGEHVPMERLRRVATDGGLDASVQPKPFFADPASSPYPFALTAARPGTCGDVFDLEACISDYVRLIGQRHQREPTRDSVWHPRCRPRAADARIRAGGVGARRDRHGLCPDGSHAWLSHRVDRLDRPWDKRCKARATRRRPEDDRSPMTPSTPAPPAPQMPTLAPALRPG